MQQKRTLAYYDIGSNIAISLLCVGGIFLAIFWPIHLPDEERGDLIEVIELMIRGIIFIVSLVYLALCIVDVDETIRRKLLNND